MTSRREQLGPACWRGPGFDWEQGQARADTTAAQDVDPPLICARRLAGEGGFTVVLGAIGIAILLLIFAGTANLVLDEYAKGALRTAVDEAAQAGATAGGSITACETEAAQVRSNLVRGPFSAGVSITCAADGTLMVAVAKGALPSLLPPVPSLHVSVTGVSVIEEAPAQ